MDILLLMIGELPMKQIINSGIYSVDLHGTNNAEFAGEHPSLILRSIKIKICIISFLLLRLPKNAGKI